MEKLDLINEKILRELERDGRISMTELGDRVGLSSSACLCRVQELERSGVIKGYRAIIDPASRGAGFSTLVAVGPTQHDAHSQATFERAVARAGSA